MICRRHCWLGVSGISFDGRAPSREAEPDSPTWCWVAAGSCFVPFGNLLGGQDARNVPLHCRDAMPLEVTARDHEEIRHLFHCAVEHAYRVNVQANRYFDAEVKTKFCQGRVRLNTGLNLVNVHHLDYHSRFPGGVLKKL